MSLTAILITLAVGFVVGLLARAIKPGNDNMGILLTTALGVAGSFVANFVGQALGLYQAGALAGWIASVVGAIVLLLVVGMVRNRAKS